MSPGAVAVRLLDQPRSDRFFGADRTACAGWEPRDRDRAPVRPRRTLRLPMQIVIPASCPPRKSPFDKDSRNRHGSPPLRSSLGPHPAAVGPKSLSRVLAGYDSPARVQLTPKALFHLLFSRSDRRD